MTRSQGYGGDDSLTGRAGDDRIYGGEGNDTIDGGAGEDRIVGGGGDDSLTGGADADTFVFGESHGNDTITDFADGTDIIDLSALDGVTQLNDLTITDVGGNAVITTSTGNTITLTGVSSSDLDASDFVFSTTGDDTDNTIEGGDRDDDLEGLGGNDSLSGGAGEDWIDGGAGNDSMSGGADADVFVFEAGHGNDTITDFTVDEDCIDLSALDGVTQFNDLTIADDGNGNAVITTSTGNTITLTGVSTEDLDADDFVFSTTGDDTDNTIEGGWWKDTIEGLGGNDSLTGGTGADTFVFGAGHGNDTITDFTVDWDCIDLSAVAGATSFDALTFTTEGNDTVIDTGQGTIRLEGVALDDLDAGDFVFSTVGDADNDTITGGDDDDVMTGAGGADTFVFGTDHGNDTITDFADGTDIIDLSAVAGATSFEALTITTEGNDAVIETGQGTIRLEGVAANDLDASNFEFSTVGDADNDTITGGADNDTIDGRGGDDSMTGGAGEDTFVFGSSHGNDTITDFTDGEDLIDLSQLTGISGFSDLTSVTADGNDVVIDTGSGTIRLEDVSLSDIDEEDFVFYQPPMEDGM